MNEKIKAIEAKIEELRTDLKTAYEAREYDKCRRICDKISGLEYDIEELKRPGPINISPVFDTEDEEIEHSIRMAAETRRVVKERRRA